MKEKSSRLSRLCIETRSYVSNRSRREKKEARVFLFYMKKSSRYWLWGATCILLINVVFFIFRKHVADAVSLWVVILTPIACLMLYPLTRFLDRDRTSAGEKGA